MPAAVDGVGHELATRGVQQTVFRAVAGAGSCAFRAQPRFRCTSRAASTRRRTSSDGSPVDAASSSSDVSALNLDLQIQPVEDRARDLRRVAHQLGGAALAAALRMPEPAQAQGFVALSSLRLKGPRPRVVSQGVYPHDPRTLGELIRRRRMDRV
jgi:hypothetical protein